MSLVLLVGGVRSGKSQLAVDMAAGHNHPVTVIVTGEARDEEMAERIRRHRELRPEQWETVEEPVELEAALASLPEDSAALVDCLTLWVSNLVEKGLDDDEISERARQAAAIAAARTADTIVVTNEVGSGIVPADRLARRYRDMLGHVNSIWGQASERAALVIAGQIVPLSGIETIWGKR